jgi:Putative Actinobacterial Holin-X, holin superfamily III
MLGLFAQINTVRRQLETLAALNLELAKLEGKQKATALGVAAGLGVGAAVLVVYGIGFALAAAAAGLAEALPLWLSLLIVAGVIFLLAGVLVFLAMRSARKATPPQPAQAIQEADLTLRTLRGNG